MTLHPLDLTIIAGYFLTVVLVGLWVSRKGSKNMDGYFLGGRTLPWWMLGISDASGMFDISGTMWLVYILFIYGLKSLWLPWLWPTFNQIFLMMFLSAWLRRSNVLTGAEWIQTRFGTGTGGTLAHLSVVFFALINVAGLLAYGFQGIGKFAADMLPWHFTSQNSGLLSNANIYAILILGLTSVYAIKGGMISVVATEVMQFGILTLTALAIGIIAIFQVSPALIRQHIPPGWTNPWFGWHLHLDWSGIMEQANAAIQSDGNSLFGILFGIMFFKGILASLAGPAPNYDMQRILATRNPREACLMNGMVNVVLYFPRYLMIAGITVMALAFCMPDLRSMARPDFEQILPIVLRTHVPPGVLGFLLAGLMAAFMSNFAATLNAAPAYLVNDLYKRFVNRNLTGKREVFLCRLASILFLMIGILCGLVATSIGEVMMWLVGGLYGGYVMANILKWYWWRFNGQGYFWGMTAGISAAILSPPAAQFLLGHPISNTLYLFPFILAFSVAGCLAGTYLWPPEDEALLMKFYRNVRPWGFWEPIQRKVMLEDPSFKPNTRAWRDLGNVATGILWQLCLTALPIYLVLRDWSWVAVCAFILLATSLLLKFNWHDHLDEI